MFMKKPKHRTFDYTPRFYVPEKDELEKKKRKLGFSRKLHMQRRKSKNPLVWILLLIILIIIYLMLMGI